MTFTDDRYLNVKELAGHYGCSVGAIYKRIAAGKFLPGVYVGRNRRWLMSELEAWERDNLPRAVPGGGPSPRERARLKRLAQGAQD